MDAAVALPDVRWSIACTKASWQRAALRPGVLVAEQVDFDAFAAAKTAVAAAFGVNETGAIAIINATTSRELRGGSPRH